MDPAWNTIEVRKSMDPNQAWNVAVDLAAKRFDIEVLSKEDGYLRTGWLFTWTGKLNQFYKVRTVMKFSPDKNKVEVKSEAQYFHRGFFGNGWQMGTDERLMSTMRTDLMGKLGRTTR